ncbi:hypothetical protein VPH35_052549 [Triticum aestivum]
MLTSKYAAGMARPSSPRRFFSDNSLAFFSDAAAPPPTTYSSSPAFPRRRSRPSPKSATPLLHPPLMQKPQHLRLLSAVSTDADLRVCRLCATHHRRRLGSFHAYVLQVLPIRVRATPRGLLCCVQLERHPRAPHSRSPPIDSIWKMAGLVRCWRGGAMLCYCHLICFVKNQGNYVGGQMEMYRASKIIPWRDLRYVTN